MGLFPQSPHRRAYDAGTGKIDQSLKVAVCLFRSYLGPAGLRPAGGIRRGLQGYLAHKKLPTTLGLPWGPSHGPAAGS